MAEYTTETELEKLMESLTNSDEEALNKGVMQMAGAVMAQRDIDYLVSILSELQKYREIGTPEECAEYKRKALG